MINLYDMSDSLMFDNLENNEEETILCEWSDFIKGIDTRYPRKHARQVKDN